MRLLTISASAPTNLLADRKVGPMAEGVHEEEAP